MTIAELWNVFCSIGPIGIYLIEVNNGNTKIMCEICWKLTIKIPERRHGIFIDILEQISHIALVFLLSTLHMKMPVGRWSWSLWLALPQIVFIWSLNEKLPYIKFEWTFTIYIYIYYKRLLTIAAWWNLWQLLKQADKEK